MPVARTVLRNWLSLSQNSLILLLPCLHFFQFPFLCQSVYSGDCFGRFLPCDWKAIPSPIFSLCFIWSFFLCLAVWLHASWQGICPQVFIDQSLAFLCVYPSIHPSIQPVFASPPRWLCFGWTVERQCAVLFLRPGPAQAASASSLSSSCKTHQLLVSCAYNTYCLSGITWSLFVYDLLFNFCFLSFQ